MESEAARSAEIQNDYSKYVAPAPVKSEVESKKSDKPAYDDAVDKKQLKELGDIQKDLDKMQAQNKGGFKEQQGTKIQPTPFKPTLMPSPISNQSTSPHLTKEGVEGAFSKIHNNLTDMLRDKKFRSAFQLASFSAVQLAAVKQFNTIDKQEE